MHSFFNTTFWQTKIHRISNEKMLLLKKFFLFINYAVTHINGLHSTNSICSVSNISIFFLSVFLCSFCAEFNEQRNNDNGDNFMRKPEVSANKAHSQRICLHNKKVKHLFHIVMWTRTLNVRHRWHRLMPVKWWWAGERDRKRFQLKNLPNGLPQIESNLIERERET